MSDNDEISISSNDDTVEKTEESYYESEEETENESDEETEYISDDDDLPVDILIKNITKDKLMMVLDFINQHKFEYTESCTELDFADENTHYFQKYVRSYIRKNTTLPKYMESIVNDQLHHIQFIIDDLGEDNEYNEELLHKIENMTYH